MLYLSGKSHFVKITFYILLIWFIHISSSNLNLTSRYKNWNIELEKSAQNFPTTSQHMVR